MEMADTSVVLISKKAEGVKVVFKRTAVQALETQVDDQADGPFVWETTVSLTDLQKTDKNHIFVRNKVMCSVHTLLGTL